jgi:hypothetical protein
MKYPLLHGNMKKEQTQRQKSVFTKTLGGFVIAIRNKSFVDSK